MSNYMILTIRIDYHIGFFVIDCTDSRILEWIENMIKKTYPKNKINRDKHWLYTGGSKNIRGLAWHIIDFLCSSGWEPFTASSLSDTHVYYHFRKKEE